MIKGSRINGLVGIDRGEITRVVRVTIKKSEIIEREGGEGRTRHYFKFGHNIWLSARFMEKYALSLGDVLDLEAAGNTPRFLLKKEKGQIKRIPLIHNYDLTSGKPILDHTSSSNIHAEKMVGLRVLEYTETSSGKFGGRLTAGGRDLPLLTHVPWEVAPIPISALVEDGKRVLFFSDRETFTMEEWGLVKLIVQSRGTILDLQPKADEISTIEEAAKNQNEARLLKTTGLVRGHNLYIAAFCFNPCSGLTYLDQAMELRREIVLRKMHLARRAEYGRWARKNLGPSHSSLQDKAKILANYIGSNVHNLTSVAYFLEKLARLADQNEGIQRFFTALPLVFGLNRTIDVRMVGACRLLAQDMDSNYIPRWILNHPPAESKQQIALFRNRRRTLKLEDEPNFKTPWKELPPEPKGIDPKPKTKPKPKNPVFNYDQLNALYMIMVERFNASFNALAAGMAASSLIVQINRRLKNLEKTPRKSGSSDETKELQALKGLTKAFYRRISSDSI